jgi:hypothetical protein
LAVLAAALSFGGCATEGERIILPSTTAGSTTSLALPAGVLPQPVSTLSLAEFMQRVGKAATATSLCDYISLLDQPRPAAQSAGEPEALYSALSAAATQLTPVVPPAVSADWATFTQGLNEAVAVARRATSADDPALRAVLEKSTVAAAIDQLFAWSDVECRGAPTTTAGPTTTPGGTAVNPPSPTGASDSTPATTATTPTPSDSMPNSMPNSGP